MQHFSYGLLFVWSVMEGEIGLAFGGYLSQEGKLYFPYVLGIAIAGAIIGDILLYTAGYLSRNRAERLLESCQGKVKRVERWFQRFGAWVIVFERFVYGTHIPALLIIGMSGFGFLRFLILDLIGVLLWAVTFTALGFYFGQTIVDAIAMIQRHLSIVIIAGLFFFVIYQLSLSDESDRNENKNE